MLAWNIYVKMMLKIGCHANPGKTWLLLIGRKEQINAMMKEVESLKDKTWKDRVSKHIRLLGAWFDHDLSGKTQLAKCMEKANIARDRFSHKALLTRQRRMITKAVIEPQLVYGPRIMALPTSDWVRLDQGLTRFTRHSIRVPRAPTSGLMVIMDLKPMKITALMQRERLIRKELTTRPDSNLSCEIRSAISEQNQTTTTKQGPTMEMVQTFKLMDININTAINTSMQVPHEQPQTKHDPENMLWITGWDSTKQRPKWTPTTTPIKGRVFSIPPQQHQQQHQQHTQSISMAQITIGHKTINVAIRVTDQTVSDTTDAATTFLKMWIARTWKNYKLEIETHDDKHSESWMYGLERHSVKKRSMDEAYHDQKATT